MSLTDTAIRNAKPRGKLFKLSDGGGLHLVVQPNGTKLWRQAYRFNGKQRTLAFGIYPTVPLAEARARRDAAKKYLADGVDPSLQRKIDKRARVITFRLIAEELLEKMQREGRALATLTKTRWLLDYAFAGIGERPVAKVTALELLDVLRKIEGRGTYETARRLRSTCGMVFRYAIATGRAERDPSIDLRGAPGSCSTRSGDSAPKRGWTSVTATASMITSGAKLNGAASSSAVPGSKSRHRGKAFQKADSFRAPFGALRLKWRLI